MLMIHSNYIDLGEGQLILLTSNTLVHLLQQYYGIINSHGFNLLGRLDESDLRGCNQMLI